MSASAALALLTAMLRARRRGRPGPAGSARQGGLAFYVLWALREPPRRLGRCGPALALSRSLSGLGSTAGRGTCTP